MMQKAVRPFDTHVVAQPEVDERSDIDLLAIARTLWGGKLWIALAVALALAYGWYKVNIASVPLYTAQTQMALTLAQPSALDIQSVVRGFSGDRAGINTEMAVVTSGELMGVLVDELGLDQDPEFNPFIVTEEDRPGPLQRAKQAVKDAIRSALPGDWSRSNASEEPSPEAIRRAVVANVRAAFKTTSNWDTYVFTISATSRDSRKAALLANTLGRLYSEEQIRTKVEAAERMAAWLSARVGELRPEIERRQNQIAALRARSALVSEEGVQALNAQAIELRTALSVAENKLARSGEQLAALRAAEETSDTEAMLDAAQDGQLAAMADALTGGGAEGRLRFDRRFAQILRQTEAEQARAQEQVDELREQVGELTEQFEGQATDLLALQQLEQDAQATQVLYETFLSRLKEASVQSSAYEADSRLLTAASPGRQVAPRSSTIMSMSLLLGLLAGSALVLGREYLQNTFRTAEDLERHTGRPVVGQVPLIPVRSRPDVIRYLLDKPTSAAAEAVRNLRTSILLSDIDHPPQIIMATSSLPSEGKTTTSIALALNLAGLGKRVLLIEGDIRRRTFEAYFGTAARRTGGLLSVVTGRQTLEEAVLRPEGLNIDVLMGERSTVNAADLFSSESFQRFLQDTRSAYDYIVVDTPPVLIVPDARVIAQHADAVVYIVHWDRTMKSQVQSGLQAFRSVNATVSGLVLTKINPKGMRRYGHGTYGQYGRGYYEA